MATGTVAASNLASAKTGFEAGSSGAWSARDRWLEWAGLVAPLPGVVLLLWSHAERPHYEFWPVYLAACGWLLWSRWPRIAPQPARGSSWALCAGLVVTAAALVLRSPSLSMVSWLLVLLGLGLRRGGSSSGWTSAWATLWLLLPLPFGFDADVIQAVRSLSAALAGLGLDALGVLYLKLGNVFESPSRRFFIEDACSGMNSLMLYLAAAAWWSAYGQLRWFCVLPLFVYGAATAILLNAYRMVAVVAVAEKLGWDWSTGWAHELLGVTCFVGGQLLLWNAASLLRSLSVSTIPAGAESAGEFDPNTADPPSASSVRSSGFALVGIVALCVSAAGQVVAWKPMWTSWMTRSSASDTVSWEAGVWQEMSDGLLPTEWHGWRQVPFQDDGWQAHAETVGRLVHRWVFEAPFGQVVAAIDAPFTGAHRLEVCYEKSGWECQVVPSEADAVSREVQLHRADLAGHLAYRLLSRDGAAVTLGQWDGVNPFHGSVLSRLWQRLQIRGPEQTQQETTDTVTISTETVQLQVLAIADTPLSPEQRQSIAAALSELTQRVQQRLAETKSPGGERSAQAELKHDGR
jgi:exosortase